ncbi:MAG: RNA polymerase sigma factor [Chitinispirillaceae bacterium]
MPKVLEPTAELLQKCKDGNRAAFREIFDMYRSYAYNLIYKIAGPHGDHEDLIQEVFFQIYLSMKSFKGESTFKTWFHRVVIHVCTRQWRYQNTGKRISPKDTVSYDLVEHGVAHNGMNHAKHYELKSLVEKALEAIDTKLRVPLVLHIYSELDLSEISTIIGIPEGTVKSRLFTARKKLREYLDSLESG